MAYSLPLMPLGNTSTHPTISLALPTTLPSLATGPAKPLASASRAPFLLTLSVLSTLPASPVYITAHQPPPPTAYTNLSGPLALGLIPLSLSHNPSAPAPQLSTHARRV